MDDVAPLSVTDLDSWLRAGAGRFGRCDKVIETSIARVYLYADRALKLKKPVDFGFLDFTTPAQRRWAIERELIFNRETAPDLYLDAHPIVAEGKAFRLGGEGEAVDWALEMKRFPDGAVLADNPEALTDDLAEALGREIARFHAAAAPGTPRRGGLSYVLGSNAEVLRREAARLGGDRLEPVLAATQALYDRLAPLLIRRGQGGMVRRCHGDLHLGNILLLDGRPVLFDCIEFNDALSEIDILYDLAFLLMDLDFRGRGAAANRAMNGWLDEAARHLPEDMLWDGLAALPLFQSVRAAVRAHVAVHSNNEATALRYLAVAGEHLAPAAPRLTAIGGRSGSGKSSQARVLAPTLGGKPGAVVLRSDEIRKRLWGRAPLEKLPPEAYAPDQSVRVYDAMIAAARACLKAERAVILDAAFLRPDERRQAEALAIETAAPFDGIWMDAPADVLRARVAARRGDASDADVQVLERQLAFDLGEVTWRRVTR